MHRYFNFIHEFIKLSEDYDVSPVRLMQSFLNCRFFHGASMDNFRVFEMFRLSGQEKKKVYTFKRQKKISDVLNKNASKEELLLLMDKNRFNFTFSKFIKRDWYDATVPDKEKYRKFLENHDRFLLKPILSSQGHGIRLLKTTNIDIESFYNDISKREVILEGVIQQHPVLESINPTSVNTCRLITARCGKNIHILRGDVYVVVGKTLSWTTFITGDVLIPLM